MGVGSFVFQCILISNLSERTMSELLIGYATTPACKCTWAVMVHVYMTCWAQIQHILHLEKIDLRPKIMIATFDLNTEWISSNLSSSCRDTAWNACSICEIGLCVNVIFDINCYVVSYTICVTSSLVSTWTRSVHSFSYPVALLVTHPAQME